MIINTATNIVYAYIVYVVMITANYTKIEPTKKRTLVYIPEKGNKPKNEKSYENHAETKNTNETKS